MSRAVIDQPGSRIVMIGLICSVGLGLLLKSQIAPARVEAQLVKAVSRLEKDFVVDFEEAHVNLSNWGLPWPRLEINRVRLSPKTNVCQSSQIFIEQIEVPISWNAIFSVQNAVTSVRAHQVEMRLGNLSQCLNETQRMTKAAEGVATNLSSNAVQSNAGAATIFQRRTNAQLKEIYIDQLKIILKDQSQQPVVLRQLGLKLHYQDGLLDQIYIASRIFALNDAKADVFYLVGDITGAIKASQNNAIEAEMSLNGRMLDGHIQLFAQYNSLVNKASYNVSTKRVSAKAFLPLLKLNGFESVFEKWPVNLSFELSGQTQSLAHSPVSHGTVSQIELSGARTQVAARDLSFEVKDNKLKVDPFTVLIDRLPLDQFKNFPQFKNDLNSFDDLGDITGDVKFTHSKNWKLNGILLNTSFIFSNRGTRELQKIDSVHVSSSQQGEQLDLKLTEFKVNDQLVNGQLDADFNERNHSLTAKMNLQGQLLNPKIWKQLTQVEQAPDVKVSWSYQKSGDLRQQVGITTPKLSFEGYVLQDLRIDLMQAIAGAKAQSLVLNMNAKEALITVSELTESAALSIFGAETGLQDEAYQAKKLRLNLKGSDWKSMSFDFDLGLASVSDAKQTADLSGKGQWQNDDTLIAIAALRTPSRTIKYDITRSVQNDIIVTPVTPNPQ